MDERSSSDDAFASRGSLVDSRRLLFEKIVTKQASRPEVADEAAAAGTARRNGRLPKSVSVNNVNSFRDELFVPSTRVDVRTTTANDDSTEGTPAIRRHSHNNDEEFRATDDRLCARDQRTFPVPSAAVSASAAQSPSPLLPKLLASQTLAPFEAASQTSPSIEEIAASSVPRNECHSPTAQLPSSEDVSPVPVSLCQPSANTFPSDYSKRVSYHHAVLNGARLKMAKTSVTKTSSNSRQLLSNNESDGNHLDNVELADRPRVLGDSESPTNDAVAATPTTSLPVDDLSVSSNVGHALLSPSSRDSCESLAIANDKPAQVVNDKPILLADDDKPAETAGSCKSAATADSKESIRLADDCDLATPTAPVGRSDPPTASNESGQPVTNKPNKPAVKSKPDLPVVKTKPIRSSSPVAAPSTAADDYPEELNPFGDDDESDKESRPLEMSVVVSTEHNSTNPFGSGSDDDDADESKSTAVSTNPFWSGSEEEEEEENSYSKTPVPLPRSVMKPFTSSSPQPSPRPRPRSRVTTGYSSNEISPTSSCRKLSADSAEISFDRSSSSNNFTPRKKKPAPPPPPLQANTNSTTSKNEYIQNNENEQSKMVGTTKINLNDSKKVSVTESKESANTKVVNSWKHKKRPAPARPTPLRRPVKEMPLEDIKVELEDIEIRYQELVRQTGQLEEKIRVQTDVESAESTAVEEMVVQLFELVNEKNELFRRRSELVNMRKMHSLEVEQADIEYQIRCLMLRPESNKTDTDKANEEALVKRLVEVVEKRNEIIDLMDKDRLRETVEDESVTTQLVPITNRLEKKEHNYKEKKKKNKKDKNKEHDDSDKNHSPSKLIKQKFMTLRHTAKKLHPKLPD